MSKSKKNRNSDSNPNCFSIIFRRLICTGDLPTYPDHDHHQINQTDSSNVKISVKETPLVQIQDERVHQMNPGIVARLMGLDSMPENNIYTPTQSPFFRSKSLNSLHFFPDFNSNKASYSVSHYRSASFSHLGSAFSIKIDEEIKSSKLQSHENRGGVKQSVKKQGKREKVVETNSKGNERTKNRGIQKYEEGYATKTSKSVNKNNVGCGRGSNLIRDQKHALLVKKQGKLRGGRGVIDVGLNVSSKRRVHHDHDKEEDLNNHVDNEVSGDSLSRSPVSVLDHHLLHLHLDYSPSKEDERGKTSSARRKPTTKNKTRVYNEMKEEYIMPKVPKKHGDEVSSKIEGRKLDNDNQKLKKTDDQEAEISEYFVGLMGQICRLTEEHVSNSKWVAKSLGFDLHFEEELSLDFGGQIFDFLLNELIDELLIRLRLDRQFFNA